MYLLCCVYNCILLFNVYDKQRYFVYGAENVNAVMLSLRSAL